MSIGARLNKRLTQAAVGRHLPRRTVRVRLTLLYGALFLLSGAALLAITYALFVNATGFVVTGQNGWSTELVNGHPVGLSRSVPAAVTAVHTRFPKLSPNQVAAVLAASGNVNMDAEQGLLAAEGHRRQGHVLRYLALESGIALAGMSLLSLALGWLMAGRVLQPLEDSYQAQRQFVANASHELRTPLTRQRALIQVALADPQASFSSLRAAHERVLASEQHLEQMIDALLTLTRGQAGLERREHLDLAAIASQTLLARESEAASRDLDVRATLATAPAAGDPRLVERLIANLLDNAIRHNTPAGHLEITTGTRDRRAFLVITNSGPAVPPEQIQRLFQPFQRLGGVRTKRNGGHGLGLSIVQAIATAHRAELITRPRPQGGLTIEVSFPPVSGAPSRVISPLPRQNTAAPVTVSETDAPARG
ncbi:MAG: sensor histidine kinase [Solirubrobacteraceae bacterium]